MRGAHNRIDETGNKYGRLTVISPAPTGNGCARWVCACACGNEIVALATNLRKGNTSSCGCYRDEVVGKSNITHGHTTNYGSTRTHRIWSAMWGRVRNKKNASYGGRGITANPRWRDFNNFLQDMGECPPGLTLDRIDTDGEYSKDNCRWATYQEQANNKRNNRVIEFDGRSQTMSQWANEIGISPGALFTRLEVLKGPAARALQAELTKPTLLVHDGESLTVTQWANKLGLKRGTLQRRLARGIPIRAALTSGSLRRRREGA